MRNDDSEVYFEEILKINLKMEKIASMFSAISEEMSNIKNMISTNNEEFIEKALSQSNIQISVAPDELLRSTVEIVAQHTMKQAINLSSLTDLLMSERYSGVRKEDNKTEHLDVEIPSAKIIEDKIEEDPELVALASDKASLFSAVNMQHCIAAFCFGAFISYLISRS